MAPDLGDECDRIAARLDMREAGVEADAGDHHAQAVRSDDTQQMGARRLQHGLFEGLTRRAEFAEPGGDDDGGTGAARPGLGDQARHGVRRRRDHAQIGSLGQGGDRGIGEHALDGAVLGVDGHHRAVEPRVEQIARQNLAHRAGLPAGADQGDGPWVEQGVKVADRHGPLQARRRPDHE